MMSSPPASFAPHPSDLTPTTINDWIPQGGPLGNFKNLNNSAMVFLRHERSDEAISLLGIALRASNCASAMFIQERRQQEQDSLFDIQDFGAPTGEAHHICSALPFVQTMNADDPLSESVEFENEDISALSPGNFFVFFNRVFVFGDITHRNWRNFFPHIPALLLYNTGLVWHRMALKENSTTKYGMALENYRMAHDLVVQNTRLGLCNGKVCELLLLAICNNMGHIYSHFHSLGEARECVEEMCAVFFLIEDKTFFSEEEYGTFMQMACVTAARGLVALCILVASSCLFGTLDITCL
jgi:hypothetical protein